MPLIFSPLSDEVVNRPPTALLPKRAFVMRQIGEPPAVDAAMNKAVRTLLKSGGYRSIDATSTTAGKDYLERIIGLIRATGFTVAIFSELTRPGTMANIALELGFAAMSGKPLIICKSKLLLLLPTSSVPTGSSLTPPLLRSSQKTLSSPSPDFRYWPT